ncbi:unnamed protein product [Gordionus sp. m RMFG-2023]
MEQFVEDPEVFLNMLKNIKAQFIELNDKVSSKDKEIADLKHQNFTLIQECTDIKNDLDKERLANDGTKMELHNLHIKFNDYQNTVTQEHTKIMTELYDLKSTNNIDYMCNICKNANKTKNELLLAYLSKIRKNIQDLKITLADLKIPILTLKWGMNTETRLKAKSDKLAACNILDYKSNVDINVNVNKENPIMEIQDTGLPDSSRSNNNLNFSYVAEENLIDLSRDIMQTLKPTCLYQPLERVISPEMLKILKNIDFYSYQQNSDIKNLAINAFSDNVNKINECKFKFKIEHRPNLAGDAGLHIYEHNNQLATVKLTNEVKSSPSYNITNNNMSTPVSTYYFESSRTNFKSTPFKDLSTTYEKDHISDKIFHNCRNKEIECKSLLKSYARSYTSNLVYIEDFGNIPIDCIAYLVLAQKSLIKSLETYIDDLEKQINNMRKLQTDEMEWQLDYASQLNNRMRINCLEEKLYLAEINRFKKLLSNFDGDLSY